MCYNQIVNSQLTTDSLELTTRPLDSQHTTTQLLTLRLSAHDYLNSLHLDSQLTIISTPHISTLNSGPSQLDPSPLDSPIKLPGLFGLTALGPSRNIVYDSPDIS